MAAFAVVQMHAIGGYLYWYGKDAAALHPQFVVADLYYAHLRWATPFFIMISGALLLSSRREETLGAFLKRRMRRVLIPFAFWGGIYLLYLFREQLLYGPMPTWSQVSHKIFYEDIYFHLWFIPMIAGLYLLTPVLKLWVKATDRRHLEYFLIIVFISNAAHLYLPNLLIIKHFSWFGYIGYYLLGYYLSYYSPAPQVKRWIYVSALFMPFLSAWLTWWLSAQKGEYYDIAFVYASPNVVLMTSAWFLFLREYSWERFAQRYSWLHRKILRIAEVSFGVYFIHPLVLDVLKNGYLGVRIEPHYFLFSNVPIAMGGLLTGIVAFLVSALLVELLHRWSFGRNWLT